MVVSPGHGEQISYGAHAQGTSMTQSADLKKLTELNAVDRLGDRAKENPNSADQHHSENNHGDDGPKWRGAALIPLRSNHEVDCVPHVQFPSIRPALLTAPLPPRIGDPGELGD